MLLLLVESECAFACRRTTRRVAGLLTGSVPFAHRCIERDGRVDACMFAFCVPGDTCNRAAGARRRVASCIRTTAMPTEDGVMSPCSDLDMNSVQEYTIEQSVDGQYLCV